MILILQIPSSTDDLADVRIKSTLPELGFLTLYLRQIIIFFFYKIVSISFPCLWLYISSAHVNIS